MVDLVEKVIEGYLLPFRRYSGKVGYTSARAPPPLPAENGKLHIRPRSVGPPRVQFRFGKRLEVR